MNRRAKFDAASFILGGKIRNRTNTKLPVQNKQTNKQMVTDISTLCLSACVDIMSGWLFPWSQCCEFP